MEERTYPKIRLNQPWDILARTVLNNTVAGKLNVVGDVILLDGSTSTEIADPLITRGSFVALMPLSAAAAMIQPSMYFNHVRAGGVTVHHPDPKMPDARFRYIVIG